MLGPMAKRKELWDRLDHESERAYRAFEIFLFLGHERSTVKTYQEYTGNYEASRVPGNFSEWVTKYAWRDRAAAYDVHISQLRRKGMEKAIEKEAEKAARQGELTRMRLGDLLANAYEKSMQALEELEPSSIQFRDIVQVAKLHLEYTDKLGMGSSEGDETDDWTEDDDEFVSGVVAEIEARREAGDSPEDDPGEAEESL